MLKTLLRALLRKLPIAAQPAPLVRGLPPDWRSGFAQIGLKKTRAVVTWGTFPCGLGFNLRCSNRPHEDLPATMEAHLGAGPARAGHALLDLNLLMLHISLVTSFSAAPRLWPKEPREIGAGIMASGWCYLRAWADVNAQTGSGIKDWRRFGSDIRDIVFGRERIVDSTKDKEPPRILALYMPDGKRAYCQVATKTVIVSRSRWPWPTTKRFFNLRTGQQGYDQGINDGTFRANSWPEAFGIIYMDIARKRGLGEVPAGQLAPGRCAICRGIGATLDKPRSYCEACKGTGALSATEWLRQLAISGELSRDIKQLDLLAEHARLTADHLTLSRTLYSAAVLALRENRLGYAAKYAGMALASIYGNSPHEEQLADLCRLLIGWVPRIKPQPSDVWAMKFSTILQVLPDGGLVVLPDWKADAFAEMLPEELAQAPQLATLVNALEAVQRNIQLELGRAGMPEKDSPVLYIRAMQAERAQLQDAVFLAKNLFGDLVRIGIPEGIAGQALRNVLDGVRGFFDKMKEPLPQTAA